MSQWKESSDASVTVFRAEVSRFKALKDEADKANDRAHPPVVIQLTTGSQFISTLQIEEQEIFAMNSQRQLKTTEAELKDSKEHCTQLDADIWDLQEPLKERDNVIQSMKKQLQDLEWEKLA